MRYSKGVVITLLAKGLLLPIGVATSIITARTLGPEGKGVLALMIFFQGLTVQFGTLGMNASITYYMSREPESASGIARNAVTIAVAGGIIIAIGLWTAANLLPTAILGSVPIRLLEIFLLSVPFTFLSQFLQNVFLAKQRILEFNLLDLGVRILQMSAFGVVLWMLGGDTSDAIWVFTGAAVVGGIVYTYRVHKLQPFTPGFDPGLFARMFSYGSRIYLSSILMFLIFRIHLMLINAMLGEGEAGIFSVALQFVDIVYLIPVALGLILFPKVSAGEDPDALLTRRVLRTTAAGMFVVCAVIALFSEPVILLMFGDAFARASHALLLLTPGILALSLSTILNNDLAGRGLPSVVLIAPSVVLVLMIPAMIVLLPSYGIDGAALIASAGDVLLLIILSAYFRRRFELRWNEMFILRKADLQVLSDRG